LHSRLNGPLPPRRTRRVQRRRRRFPVYGLITLVLFLCSGMLYARAADVFFEKEKPSQAAEASGDLAALPGSADPEGISGDEDMELTQEKPDESGEKPTKEKAKGDREKAESKKPEREKPGKEKPNAIPAGKKEERPSTAATGRVNPPQLSVSKTDHPQGALSAFEREVVELVNRERAQRGLAPLKVDVGLSRVACVKSEDMRDNGYFSHESPTYGSPFDMMRKFGIRFRTAGENIAAGYPTPEEAVKGWMNSSGHRANILSSQFTHIGVGYAKGGPYGHYWTQQFIGK